jgi:molybdopterin-binding protein
MTQEPASLTDILHVDPEDPAPDYVQLERRVRMAVADGTLRPGHRLPSVRSLARQIGVAPNTVGRAYAELAREGVIQTRAGAGSEVAPLGQLNRPALVRARRERLRVMARQVSVRGLALGMSADEIVGAVVAELQARGHSVGNASDKAPGDLQADEAALLSARNRLRGRVADIRLGDVLAEVAIALDEEQAPLVAAVTRASVQRLGLRTGGPVSAVVKATEVVLGR